jgi:hypothetical protein
MKKYLLIAFLSFFMLTNCSVDGNNGDSQTVRVLWNLETVTGGVSGVNHTFSPNVVFWEFYVDNNALVVGNLNTNSALEDGLDTGVYSFQINKVGNISYLSIDSSEIGSITVTETSLTINQNEKSAGNGTDGYIYTFKKSIITE